VRFMTVPVQAYAPDPNRVQINRALAEPLFEAIRKDNTVPRPAPAPAQPKNPNAPEAPPVPPAQVQVAVYNATRTDGLGQRTAAQLEEKGFKVVKIGSRQASAGTRTQILFGPGAQRHAAALAAAMPGHPPRPHPSGKPGLVYLVVGQDGADMPGTPKAVPKVAGEIRADRDVCEQTSR